MESTGAFMGIEGILKDELIDLRKEDSETIRLLKQTPLCGSRNYTL